MQFSNECGRILPMILVLICMVASVGFAQDQSVGLFEYDSLAHDGYTLFAPMRYTDTYLVDMYGRVVHQWEHDYPPAASVYLLENGHLLRTVNLGYAFGGGGRVEELDWNGNVVWQYDYASDGNLQHHDIERLPNGNVLILAWESISKAEAIAAGRDPAVIDGDSIMPEHVIEVEPTYPQGGEIVWEWHMWDHMVQDFDSTKDNYGSISEHPELIDVNYTVDGRADWVHANSVEYNPELDQIIISLRWFDEFWVIDHSTTTAEAAGHSGGNSGMGGDLLYRWGNPYTYKAGDIEDRILSKQHDAQWIDEGLPGEGNILVFNNGYDRGFSSVDELIPPVDQNGNYTQPSVGEPFDPDELEWTFFTEDPDDFYSLFISGCQRLENGNTLICAGPQGELFEVTDDGKIVWRYINPIGPMGTITQGQVPTQNNVFRCYRYDADYPGLADNILEPMAAIENYGVTISGTEHFPANPNAEDSIVITSEVFSDNDLHITSLFIDTGSGFFMTTMFDDGAHGDGAAGDSVYGAVLQPITGNRVVPYYVYASTVADSSASDPPPAPIVTYELFVEPIILCGDVNASGGIDIDDVVYEIAYVFQSGAEPDPLESGDVDCSGTIDIDDIVYLVNFVFSSGNAPCDPDGDEILDCLD